MAKAFVRVSTVKEYVKGQRKEMRVSEDAVDQLDRQVSLWIDEAIARAVAANRKTLLERDFG